jgi:type IV secretion system protein VirD4
VLYAGEDKTLRGVANFLSDPASPFELTLHRMMTTPHSAMGRIRSSHRRRAKCSTSRTTSVPAC